MTLRRRLLASLLVVSLLAPLRAGAAPDSSLLLWLPLDEGAGTLAADRSPSQLEAELANVEWAKGAFGTAAYFRGTNAFVDLPPVPSLNGATQCTLSVWATWEGTGRYPNLLTRHNWSPGGLMLFVSDNACSFRMGRPGHRAGAPGHAWTETGVSLLHTLPLRQWTHLCVVFAMPHITTYVNGQPVDKGTWPYPVEADGLRIGSWSGSVCYGIDFMRHAIFKRLRGEVLVEASEWGAHNWWFHSRLGAWDHPVWAAKRFHDLHIASAGKFRDSDLLEPQMGWWAPRQPSAQARGHFLDEMEYFGAKNLGLDSAMSIQGVNVSRQPLPFHIEKQVTVLRERDVERMSDYEWPYGGDYGIHRNPVDMAHISEVNLYLNHLPSNDSTEVVLSPIKALAVVPAELKAPALTVNRQKLALPVTLKSGEYLEVEPTGDCAHYDDQGDLRAGIRPVAAAGWPVLRSGENALVFDCAQPTARSSNSSRSTNHEMQ